MNYLCAMKRYSVYVTFYEKQLLDMGIMWALIAFPKRWEAFKQFYKLLLADIIQRSFHHHAFHLPISLLRPQLLLLDSFGDGTFWNIMQTRE